MPAHFILETAEAIEPVAGEQFRMRWSLKNTGDRNGYVTSAHFYCAVAMASYARADTPPNTPSGVDSIEQGVALAPSECYESIFDSGNLKWFTGANDDWRPYFSGSVYYVDDTGASRITRYVQCLWKNKPWSQHYHAMKLDMAPQRLLIIPGRFGLKVTGEHSSWD